MGNKRFIYLDVTQEGGTWKFTPTTGYKQLTLVADDPMGTHLATYVVKNCDGSALNGVSLNKRVRSHAGIVIKDSTTNLEVPVISIAPPYSTVFGPHNLKANIQFTTVVGPPPTGIPTTSLNAPTQVAAPKQKKHLLYKVDSLSPHVAKQLLEFAILRKEMCPITAEEFSPGNAAVLPCGHLFMQIAIEESFKKEPNKCPWCRQQGSPTFV
jgi:hypothetical protein